MEHVTVAQILSIHADVVKQTGGAVGLRDRCGLDSAAAQPRMAFGGIELYPSLEEKAAALCFSLVSNHPFVDGNKRIGHAAMEALLMSNGYELAAPIDDAE
jgi:death on curing protein